MVIILENDHDRTNEQRVKRILKEAYGMDVQKLPMRYELDFAILDSDGHIVGLVEVKTRKHEFGFYPDIILSLKKFLTAKTLSLELNVPFMFVVMDVKGDVYEKKITASDFFSRGMDVYKQKWGGMSSGAESSRGEEPLVLFPVEEFKCITPERRQP